MNHVLLGSHKSHLLENVKYFGTITVYSKRIYSLHFCLNVDCRSDLQGYYAHFLTELRKAISQMEKKENKQTKPQTTLYASSYSDLNPS